MADYSVLVASHTNYEELLVEMYVDDEFVAQISFEDGVENALLEFGPSEAPTKVKLETFERVLDAAKQRLLRLTKDD